MTPCDKDVAVARLKEILAHDIPVLESELRHLFQENNKACNAVVGPSDSLAEGGADSFNNKQMALNELVNAVIQLSSFEDLNSQQIRKTLSLLAELQENLQIALESDALAPGQLYAQSFDQDAMDASFNPKP